MAYINVKSIKRKGTKIIRQIFSEQYKSDNFAVKPLRLGFPFYPWQSEAAIPKEILLILHLPESSSISHWYNASNNG